MGLIDDLFVEQPLVLAIWISTKETLDEEEQK